MYTVKRFTLVGALVGLLMVVSPVSHSAEMTVVRLAFSSGWDALPSVVAIERGFFAEQGLIVSPLPLSNSRAVLSSLGAGSTDIAAVSQRTFLLMVMFELPVRVISVNGWGTKMELVARADDATIKSVTDLRGRVVAVGAGSDALPVLVRLLNRARIHPGAVTFKVLPPAQLTQSLEQKLADAVFESRYFTAALTADKQGRVVVPYEDVLKTLGTIGARPLVAKQSMISSEPETVQKFVHAWIKALKYIQQDPEDVAGLMRVFFHRQGTSVSNELSAAWLTMTRFDRYLWRDAEIADAEFNAWGLREAGKLKALPKIAGYIDNRFATEALKAYE